MSPAPKSPRRPAAAPRSPIAEPLRQAILDSGLSSHALGRRADVDRRNIDRFLNGERTLKIDTADRLATALGLRLGAMAVRTARRARSPESQADE